MRLDEFDAKGNGERASEAAGLSGKKKQQCEIQQISMAGGCIEEK